ncbi:MAG: hypothetical protein HC821_00845 [Lewinella sp.]|nr:hypothetical protein [Lewinella sp.]
MTRLLTLTTLLLSFHCGFLFAQTHTYSGCIVNESGEALFGVNILHKGSNKSTSTGIDGCFTLTMPNDTAHLSLSYVGYTNQTVLAKAKRPLQLVLVSQSTLLDEIVVIDYKVPLIAFDNCAVSSVINTKSSLLTSSTTSSLPTRKKTSALRSTSAGLSATPTEDTQVKAHTAAVEPPASGQLTAGEVNDFGKWEMWKDISKEDLGAHRQAWGFAPEHRYAVQLTLADGSPAIDAIVRLVTTNGTLLYQARTDQRGRAETWRGLFPGHNSAKSQDQERMRLIANYSGKDFILPTAHPIQEGLNTLIIAQPCQTMSAVDIAFVVDATGSMGDEIDYLASELNDLVSRCKDSLPGQDLRWGSVFYRDRGDQYLTRHQAFTAEAKEIDAFIRRQSASGGGDNPEAVDAALTTALDSLNWSPTAAAACSS